LTGAEPERKRLITLSLVVLPLAGLLVAGTPVAASNASSARAVVKAVFNRTLKKTILVDGRGRTLYLFTSDLWYVVSPKGSAIKKPPHGPRPP